MDLETIGLRSLIVGALLFMLDGLVGLTILGLMAVGVLVSGPPPAFLTMVMIAAGIFAALGIFLLLLSIMITD